MNALRFSVYQVVHIHFVPHLVATFLNLEMAESFARTRYVTGFLIKEDDVTVLEVPREVSA